MNTEVLLQKSKKELNKVSINPYQESLWILAEVLGISSSEVYLKKDKITANQQELFWEKIQRRKKEEPLEYILKEKFFFNKRFYIEEGVFIPRQETETLVEWVLNNIPYPEKVKAVDFGAGAGSLCLSLLSALPSSRFIAVEISSQSIKCLQKNAQAFQKEKDLYILKKDVEHVRIKDLTSFLGDRPSLITANPPYIDSEDSHIHRGVYFFDPPLSLFSDKKGMGHIISWFEKAMELLGPKGIYIFEFGWNQLEDVENFCDQRNELSSYELHRDSSGNPRMAVCFKK